MLEFDSGSQSRDAIRRFVAALMRSTRAMSYYARNHPVYAKTQAEALDALFGATQHQSTITLGCGGSRVIYDATAPALDDEVATALAKCLFHRSLIAIKVDASTTLRGLGILLELLSQSPDQLRADGGLRKQLQARQAMGVDVVEVDYEGLFAGERSDVGGLVGHDDIVERALREVLRFSPGGEGQRLTIRIDELDTPASLGSFLDELMDNADSTVFGDAAGQPAPDAIPIEAFGDLAAEAYLNNQTRLGGRPEEELIDSAKKLSHAMEQLSPAASMRLLKKLAGTDRDLSSTHSEAIGRLGDQVHDKLIVEAVGAVLFDQQSDQELVNAVGNLVRRLRPVERDRDDLLRMLDGAFQQRGQAIDGIVWNEIESRAYGKQDLGYLKMAFEEVKADLVDTAKRRLQGEFPDMPGQSILEARGERLINAQGSLLLGDLLERDEVVGATVVHATRQLIERLEETGELKLSTRLLSSLARRADIDRSTGRTSQTASLTLGEEPDPMALPTAETTLGALLAGSTGQQRTRRLVSVTAEAGVVSAQVLLQSIERASDPEYQELLQRKLSAVDPRVLEYIALDEPPTRSVRVANLIRAVGRTDGVRALRLVRHFLKSPSFKIKATALKSVAYIPDPAAIVFLHVASGAKTDAEAEKVLSAESLTEDRFTELKLIAISALGRTRQREAVPALREIATRPSGFFDKKATEDLRNGAAHALVVNGTQDALSVLKEGAQHKKRDVRDACQRALQELGRA